MLNKLIFFIFVTLGLTVICLCIIKGTKIEEHYKMNEYSDVILPCENNEMNKSYDIKNILKVLKKYNIDLIDLKLIKNKLVEKGIKGKICKRSLFLILDTYLIYYKPIIDSIITDLKKIEANDNSEEDDDALTQEIEKKKEISENSENDLEDNDNLNEINSNNYEKDYSALDDKMTCDSINNLTNTLETDGFITKKNKDDILEYYHKKCN
jgi:hypothetical protein